jgi:hypothetical protein
MKASHRAGFSGHGRLHRVGVAPDRIGWRNDLRTSGGRVLGKVVAL